MAQTFKPPMMSPIVAIGVYAAQCGALLYLMDGYVRQEAADYGAWLDRLYFYAWLHLLLALPTVIAYFTVNDGYGKLNTVTHLSVPQQLAWVLMEAPAVVASVYSLYVLSTVKNMSLMSCASAHITVPWGLYTLHYINRALIYPLRNPAGSPFPVFANIMGNAYVSFNGYTQTMTQVTLVLLGHSVNPAMVVVGTAMFFAGMAANIHCDSILSGLRKKNDGKTGDARYSIPRGGLFEYVSGANYTAEIFEWTGFAVAAGLHPVAVMFPIFTASNIGPRAIRTHRWYLDKFGDEYKKLGRSAVIPFVL